MMRLTSTGRHDDAGSWLSVDEDFAWSGGRTLSRLHDRLGSEVALAPAPARAMSDADIIVTHMAVSNDPGYTGGQLWGMYGDLTLPANAFGSQAGEAWGAGFTGSTRVAVGVIDTGIDAGHPALNRNVTILRCLIPEVEPTAGGPVNWGPAAAGRAGTRGGAGF